MARGVRRCCDLVCIFIARPPGKFKVADNRDFALHHAEACDPLGIPRRLHTEGGKEIEHARKK